MNELKYGFGAKCITLAGKAWSFGSGISHSGGETFVFINFLFWCITIGWIVKGE